MRALIETASGRRWQVELSRPLPITPRFRRTSSTGRAYYLPPARVEPYRSTTFVGSIAEGGSVNCDVVTLVPHGSGTHTECVGHISREPHYVADAVRSFLVLGQLVTIEPVAVQGGRAITREQIERVLSTESIGALIIRTLPNDPAKEYADWSGTNPPFLEEVAARYLCERQIEHLIVDLPSLDPESDGGALRAHRAFWNYPAAPRQWATVTELCYIPSAVPDGFYLVQLGILPLESDASPSMVVLYPATPLEQ